MATSSRIQVDVVLSPSSLANSLRGLADKIDPQPPMATAEDLRGAQAETERLRAVVEAASEFYDAQQSYAHHGGEHDDVLDRLDGLSAAVRAYRAATTGEAGQ